MWDKLTWNILLGEGGYFACFFKCLRGHVGGRKGGFFSKILRVYIPAYGSRKFRKRERTTDQEGP